MKRLLLLLLAGAIIFSVTSVSFAAEETADTAGSYSGLENLSEAELIELRNIINGLLGDTGAVDPELSVMLEYAEVEGLTQDEETAIQIIDAYRKAYMKYPESLNVYDVYLHNITGQDYMYKLWMEIGGTNSFGDYRSTVGILITRDSEKGETFGDRIKEAFVITDIDLNTDQAYEHLDAERIDQYFKFIDN